MMNKKTLVITKADLDKNAYYKASIDLHVDGDLLVGDDVDTFRVRGNLSVGGNHYVCGNQTVGGHQDVCGNQYVGGDQTVRGHQDVRGNQEVRGYQEVRGHQDVGKLHFCITRHFSGLYCYHVMIALTPQGVPYIHMGCLHYSLSKWKQIGIRKSNLNEFPDDGSPSSEERVRAFEFAKSSVLALKLPQNSSTQRHWRQHEKENR